MKRYSALVVALTLVSGLHAQDFGQVKQLYQAGMYSETLRLVQDNHSPLAEGYRALCALKLKTAHSRDDAKAFIARYHENILVPQVRYQLGLDYFDEEQYEEALGQFSQISVKEVQPSQRTEYNYKLGYCAFAQGEWDRAESMFLRVKDLPYSDYSAPSYYTLGYISYANKDFKEAASWFELAAKDHRFSGLADYYILECRFNEKDYDYVLRHGEDLFGKVPEDRQPHLARIMSETYLIKGDVEKARTYYEKNLRNKGNLNRNDLFYAGEINYLTENWQGAVDNFTRMEDRTDSLGQVASYQLGYSYIRLRNKVAAMDAFREASAQSYTPDIQEDALYNYAKLAFDLNRDTAPFQEYLKRYDTLKKGDQIYSYMAMVALQNHDYVAAVDAYDHIDELREDMKANYMKAYFLRARELMESGSWRSAVPHLKAAVYYSPRREGFNQLARYYQAEALYRDGKYAEARDILTDLYNLSALQNRPEGQLISYQTAYTYFKEANYDNALKWFRNYLEGDARLMGSDAETRVADCYFFTGKYSTAVTAYERQMTDYPDPDNLYPRYRAGVACGLLQDHARKVDFLEEAIHANPAAPYYGESMYELGRAYVAVKDDDNAIRTFRTLRSASSDPALAAKAMLELGMINRNAGRSDEAIACYKEVVAQGGEFAEDALLAIEAIYRTREDPEAYLAYVNSLGGAGRTEAQKEDVYFSSAEQIFLSGDYAKAQTTLRAYLEKYPQAIYGAKARFYLADCQRAAGMREQAVDLYQAALDGGLDGALQESARMQIARLQYELENYAKAYQAYLKLKENAKMDANMELAAIGLMRSAFRAHQWDDAIANANTVARAEDPALQREARYVRAKSFLSSSRRSEAFEEFQQLAQAPATDEGAEAAYLIIQDQYDRGQFDGIQERVYSFAEKAGGQNYWLAKAFIVLGDSFAEQGNLAQAKATFESIRSGYSSSGPQDDVLDQVDVRLRKLQ
ncbi:MAG: tetratricopeptide repeat protein [Bacteroidales bacterium]|nr:tetratricopeptide repeat protein [Bacteroidales bacterium]